MTKITNDPEVVLGAILAGCYRLTHYLGAGAMGEVYRAHHLRTGGEIAVKLLHPGIAAHPEIKRRFRDEARVAATLRHPHIVHVQDLHIDDLQRPFLVMELLSGEDLEARLQRQQRLSLPDALRIAAQIGSALAAAHQRSVVHRDLKPANIFLATHSTVGGPQETVRVLDFGVAKVRWTLSEVTQDRAVLGTPSYLAPEAAQEGSSQVDGRADQFALAVILYRALSGALPFQSENPLGVMHQIVHATPRPLREVAPEVTLAVEAAILRALAKRPAQRFPDIQSFVAALGGEVAPTRTSGWRRWLGRAALLLCGVTLGGLATRASQAAQAEEVNVKPVEMAERAAPIVSARCAPWAPGEVASCPVAPPTLYELWPGASLTSEAPPRRAARAQAAPPRPKKTPPREAAPRRPPSGDDELRPSYRWE